MSNISPLCFVCSAAEKIYNKKGLAEKLAKVKSGLMEVAIEKEKKVFKEYAHSSCIAKWQKSQNTFKQAREEKGKVTHVNGLPLASFLLFQECEQENESSSKRGQAFIAAAELGDLTLMKKFSHQEEIDCAFLQAALARAAENGHLKAVELVFEIEGDLKLKNQSAHHGIDLEPAHIAAVKSGHQDILEALLLKNQDRPLRYLKELLLTAANNGHIKMVEFFLKKFDCAPYLAELSRYAIESKSSGMILLLGSFLKREEFGKAVLLVALKEEWQTFLHLLKMGKISKEICRQVLIVLVEKRRLKEMMALFKHYPDLGSCNEPFKIAYDKFHVPIMIELAQRKLLHLEPINRFSSEEGVEVMEALDKPQLIEIRFCQKESSVSTLDVEKILVCAVLKGKLGLVQELFLQKKATLQNLARALAVYMQAEIEDQMNYEKEFDFCPDFQMRDPWIVPSGEEGDNLVDAVKKGDAAAFCSCLLKKRISAQVREVALLQAVENERVAMAIALLDHPVSCEKAFDLAKAKGNLALMALLIKKGGICLKSDPDFNQIGEILERGRIAFRACAGWRVDEAEKWLKEGWIFEEYLRQILLVAARKGMHGIVKAIIENNRIHPAASSKAIIEALQNRFFEDAEELLEAGGIVEELLASAWKIANQAGRKKTVSLLQNLHPVVRLFYQGDMNIRMVEEPIELPARGNSFTVIEEGKWDPPEEERGTALPTSSSQASRLSGSSPLSEEREFIPMPLSFVGKSPGDSPKLNFVSTRNSPFSQGGSPLARALGSFKELISKASPLLHKPPENEFELSPLAISGKKEKNKGVEEEEEWVDLDLAEAPGSLPIPMTTSSTMAAGGRGRTLSQESLEGGSPASRSVSFLQDSTEKSPPQRMSSDSHILSGRPPLHPPAGSPLRTQIGASSSLFSGFPSMPAPLKKAFWGTYDAFTGTVRK